MDVPAADSGAAQRSGDGPGQSGRGAEVNVPFADVGYQLAQVVGRHRVGRTAAGPD